MRKTLLAFLLCAAACAAARAQGGPGDASRLFDYDAAAPLDVRETAAAARAAGGVTLRTISYASPKGGRASAYLIEPAGRGPHPAVLFQHWGQGDKSAFLAEALLYARAGAVALVVDAPFARAGDSYRPLSLDLDKPENDRAVYVQAAIDLRRGVDLLVARRDVDARRVAFVGLSFGGHVGGILAAVEPRIKTFVLMGGPARATEMLRNRDIPGLTQARRNFPAGKWEAYLSHMATIDAARFVGRGARAPVLFQFARHDVYISEEQARWYAEAAGARRKRVEWYDVGHEFNDVDSLAARAAWLRREINLRPVAPREPARVLLNSPGRD